MNLYRVIMSRASVSAQLGMICAFTVAACGGGGGGGGYGVSPAAPAPASNGLPLFRPRFSVGPGALSGVVTNPVLSFNSFDEFVSQLDNTFATPTPATKFTASGVYNSATNIFTASNIDVVL